MYRGVLLQDGYDTNQIFSEFDVNGDSVGIHSILSPWHTRGRYLPPPFLTLFLLYLRGTPWRKPVSTFKHPLVSRIMKLPPERRIEFFNRFDSCGAFS